MRDLILYGVCGLLIWGAFLMTRWIEAGRFDDSVAFNCLVDFCRFYFWQ